MEYRYVHIIAILLVTSTLQAEYAVRAVDHRGVVGPQERSYVTQREQHAQPVSPHIHQPRVAVCCSGGGPRAMLASSGFLAGLEQSGLLPSISYVAGLSGSTWALFPWNVTPYSACDLKEHLIRQTSQFSSSDILYQLDRLIPYIVMQYIQYHRPSLIDIYGAFLAEIYLKNVCEKKPLDITSKDMAPQPDIHPFCICSCIIPKKNNQAYAWVEMTPYEIGGHDLMYYTALNNFGSKFKSGHITKQRACPTLGNCMGTCGSAISASFKEFIDMYVRRAHYRALRLFPAKMPNFTRDIENAPLRNKRHLTLIDAGIEMNLPIPPLLAPGRDIDVIIICDAASEVENAPELEKAAEWARQYGKPLPETIDYQKAGSQVCSVFESDNPYTPTIVYMPRIKNPNYDPNFDPDAHMDWEGFLNTFNFTYTQEQAQHIAGLMEFAVQDNIEVIKNAITRKADQLNTVK